MPSSQARRIIVDVPVEHAQFIDQERARLQQLTGKPWSPGEIVQLLIVQHKTRMEMKAELDPNSVAWMYRTLAERTG